MREQLLKNWQKTVKNRQFLSGFQPLLPRTLTHPNEICIVYSHTLARSPRKISARLAHRGPSNRLCRQSTRGKNGENHRFLTVFQLLLLRTLTCPNEIRIVHSHTLARSSRKISARSAYRGPSNRSQCWPTLVKNGENCRFFYGFSTTAPTYVNAHQRNSNHLLPYPSPFTT